MSEDAIFRNPRFDALRNALYHTERRIFLDKLNKLISAFIVLLGANVIGKLSQKIGFETDWSDVAVVVLATIQLVFDLGSRARDHEFLQRKYYELLAEIENEKRLDDPEKQLERQLYWSSELIKLAGDEMLTMRALDAMCYNKALFAIFSDPAIRHEYAQQISFWQRRFKNVFAFSGSEFKPQGTRKISFRARLVRALIRRRRAFA